MKFTYSWLKDHLDTDLDANAIGEALTNIGLELENIDFTKIGALEFYEPDKEKFRSLKIVEEVGRNLDLGVVFNAEKEIALDRFISGEIAFLDMVDLVEKTLAESSLANKIINTPRDVSDILEIDKLTRVIAKKIKI